MPLSRAAVDPLGERRIEALGPFVCPNPQTGHPYVQGHYAWKRACREAGLPDLRVHGLWHSFASFLVNTGGALYAVQGIPGRHTLGITGRSAYLAHGSLLDAADTVGTVSANATRVPVDKAA